jgi:hypothetical protein
MPWRAGPLLLPLLACVFAIPSAAYAEDDPLVGRWSVTGESNNHIINMRAEGSGRFVGAVAQKPDNSTLCWEVDDPVIHVTGSGGSYRGIAQLYDETCAVNGKTARIIIEIDPGGSTAHVTYFPPFPPSGGCNGCEPEIWNRAPPPPDPTRLWLLVAKATLGAVTVIIVVVLVVMLRPKARARRRARKQAQLTGNVTFRPQLGGVPTPSVRTPPVPGISIRLQPRLESGEPVVREETPA